MQIGVTGGKGGTGKSTVATALAFALAKDWRVLLVDADADCPNDHLLLSMLRTPVKKVEQRIPVWDPEKCARCAACGPVCRTNAIVAVKGKLPFFMSAQCNGCGACHYVCSRGAISWGSKEIGSIYRASRDGLDMLAGELKPNEPASERIIQEIKRIVEQKKGRYDYVIIDTAAGTHCDVVAALRGVDYVLVVTEVTPLGRHDLDLVLELIEIMGIPGEMVVNRYETGQAGVLQQVDSQYHPEKAIRIPYSAEVARRYARGEPINLKEIDFLVERINQLQVNTE